MTAHIAPLPAAAPLASWGRAAAVALRTVLILAGILIAIQMLVVVVPRTQAYPAQ